MPSRLPPKDVIFSYPSRQRQCQKAQERKRSCRAEERFLRCFDAAMVPEPWQGAWELPLEILNIPRGRSNLHVCDDTHIRQNNEGGWACLPGLGKVNERENAGEVWTIEDGSVDTAERRAQYHRVCAHSASSIRAHVPTTIQALLCLLPSPERPIGGAVGAVSLPYPPQATDVAWQRF